MPACRSNARPRNRLVGLRRGLLAKVGKYSDLGQQDVPLGDVGETTANGT